MSSEDRAVQGGLVKALGFVMRHRGYEAGVLGDPLDFGPFGMEVEGIGLRLWSVLDEWMDEGTG